MSIEVNMPGDASQAWTVDRNQTSLVLVPEHAGLRNVTDDELYPLPDYINVTLLDVNATEEIDSFYFYEVSSSQRIRTHSHIHALAVS